MKESETTTWFLIKRAMPSVLMPSMMVVPPIPVTDVTPRLLTTLPSIK